MQRIDPFDVSSSTTKSEGGLKIGDYITKLAGAARVQGLLVSVPAIGANLTTNYIIETSASSVSKSKRAVNYLFGARLRQVVHPLLASKPLEAKMHVERTASRSPGLERPRLTRLRQHRSAHRSVSDQAANETATAFVVTSLSLAHEVHPSSTQARKPGVASGVD